jgi:hypothetical protein
MRHDNPDMARVTVFFLAGGVVTTERKVWRLVTIKLE